MVFHVLLAYGLPAAVFWGLALLAGVAFYRIQPADAVAVAGSLVLVTLAYSLALKVTGIADAIYYRPDEKLSICSDVHGHNAYIPGASVDMLMPHGDLQSMTTVKIGVPHQVTYRIDSYGFRNDADYRGEKYLLVGDSFIAGSSNTQSDLLSARLARDYGIAAYNLAHPGDISDYASYLSAFKASHHDDAKALLFIFEGNDFVPAHKKKKAGLSSFFKNYFKIFSDTDVYRVTKSLYKRALRSDKIADSKDVFFAEIKGIKIGFLQHYIDVTRNAGQSPIVSFEETLKGMSPDVAHVFFIPTKYRVYHRFIDPQESLPNASWDYLRGVCQANSLRCTDLTPQLVKASVELLEKGELTFWPDDTHWNGNGVAAAARVVADVLRNER
ncbi:hypothetical protein MoryE10_17030 [Methylogaea oryzae]|uniref:AlgX/AlgJ SGNH hydrolase-like domain-containing protein n=1 Tax=Methylogaea oryzae TaxID=1295382 RepID=A0A8D4VR59_9GAMM|nr:hypothetical protein MoryE10_17030 [Methylogaea oryzae]